MKKKMKRIALLLAAVVTLAMSACSQGTANKQNDNNAQDTSNNMKKTALVAYFSATGTTEAVAKQLAKVADADLYEITPEQEYTDADLDWHNDKSRSSVEMRDLTSRPAVKGKVENIDQYDVIYVGFPIWWYTAPTIVNTFLEQYNLEGKTIVPFATSGGSNAKKAGKDLQKSAPGAKFTEGVILNGATEQSLKQLLDTLKVK